jgi:hypothetical protein
MVKRAKLTLDHSEDADATAAASQKNKTETVTDKSPSTMPDRSRQLTNFGKLLLITGLTVATLVILKRKIF